MCGTEMTTLYDEFCQNEIYVTYTVGTNNSSPNAAQYRGFRLYFEGSRQSSKDVRL